MELPGVTRRQVESLGRQNSQLAIQVGDASRLKTLAVVNTLDHITTTFDEAVVKPNYEREAIAQYAKAEYSRAEAMAETEAILSDPTGMVDTSLIPDEIEYRRFDKDVNGLEVRRVQIPTYEVAGAWYKRQLRTTQEAALAEMTNEHAIRKVKNDYNSSFMDNYARVLVDAQKQKQVHDRSELDKGVDLFIRSGKKGDAEKLMLGAIKTGVIGVAEGTELLMSIPGEVAFYKVEKAIMTSPLEELDRVETAVYTDISIDQDGTEHATPMTLEQRSTLIDKLDARRRQLTGVRKTEDAERSERTLNDQLVALQETGVPLTPDALRKLGHTMSGTDHQVLITANRSLNSSQKGVSDPLTLGILQGKINALMIPVDGQPVGVGRSAVIREIDQARDDGLLNSSDSWALIGRVESALQAARDEDLSALGTPQYKLAEDTIYKVLTQGSKGIVNLNAGAQAVLNATEADRALQEAALAGGPSFDPLKWLDANLDRYKTQNLRTNQEKLNKSLAKPYVVRTEGEFNEVASREKLKQAIKSGTIDDDIAIIAEAAINTAAEDRDFRIAQEKKGEASWWDKLWD